MLNSSLWPEKTQRDIFITALLMAEPYELKAETPQIRVDRIEETGWKVPPGWYGFVQAASAGIIHQAMVERAPGMQALIQLGEPDMESKSKKYEGRRLVRVDGGFIALNYIEYRDRDYTGAERSKRWRERQKIKAKKEEAEAKARAEGGTIRPEHRSDAGLPQRPRPMPNHVKELGQPGNSHLKNSTPPREA